MFQIFRKYRYLIIILCIGFLLRFSGISFGFPFFLHPDETKIVEPALTIAFDIKGADLNPHFFYYPHFLMYFLVIVIQILKVILLPFGIFNSLPKEAFYFIARLITVLFGTVSIYLTYLIAKKVISGKYSERVGLLSASFLAVVFLHVRNSHYYTGDVPATFFMLVSVLFFLDFLSISRKYPKDTRKILFKLILSGFLCGVGISTKYYPGLLLFLYLPAIIYQFRKSVNRVLLYCFVMLALSSIGFALFTPFAFLDYRSFIITMKESNLRSASGFMGASSNNPLYYIHNKDLSIDESFSGNSLAEGLGLGFIILSSLGIVSMLRKFIVRKRADISEIFIIALVFLFYVFFARYPVKLVRWLVCITPFLSILAAYLSTVFNKNNLSAKKISLGILFIIVIIPNLYKDARFDFALSRGDTRVFAYNYVLNEIPKNTPIIFESILIHKWVEDGDYSLFQITHDRYNTKGEIKEDYPPNLKDLLDQSHAQYIVLNGWSRQKYFNQSSYIYFPEVSEEWRSFYTDIDTRFPRVKVFDPKMELLSGPEIFIYSVPQQ